MKKLLSCAAAGAALLALCAVPQVASASTITYVSSGGTGLTAAQEGLYGVGGQVISAAPLSFASDFVDFYLTPAGATTVTVQDLANTNFPNEQWQIIGPGLNTGVEDANNVPTNITIPDGGIGNVYSLELNSGAPLVFGISTFSLTTEAPLPGALALFAGGLAMLGAGGLRKRKKDRSAISSVAAPI